MFSSVPPSSYVTDACLLTCLFSNALGLSWCWCCYMTGQTVRRWCAIYNIWQGTRWDIVLLCSLGFLLQLKNRFLSAWIKWQELFASWWPHQPGDHITVRRFCWTGRAATSLQVMSSYSEYKRTYGMITLRHSLVWPSHWRLRKCDAMYSGGSSGCFRGNVYLHHNGRGMITSMRRITTFRSTTDRIYDGGPIRF